MIKRLAMASAFALLQSQIPTECHAFDASGGSLPLPAQGTLQAAFAPWDNVEELICGLLGSAKKQILVQAYLLTSKKIAVELISAKRRGIAVQLLVDEMQSERNENSRIPDLAAAGIPVWLETKYQNAHNKIIVIDAATSDATVVTGSFNFTWTAQHRNAENILIARKNPALAMRYVMNWERHRQDAIPYKKP